MADLGFYEVGQLQPAVWNSLKPILLEELIDDPW